MVIFRGAPLTLGLLGDRSTLVAVTLSSELVGREEAVTPLLLPGVPSRVKVRGELGVVGVLGKLEQGEGALREGSE